MIGFVLQLIFPTLDYTDVHYKREGVHANKVLIHTSTEIPTYGWKSGQTVQFELTEVKKRHNSMNAIL